MHRPLRLWVQPSQRSDQIPINTMKFCSLPKVEIVNPFHFFLTGTFPLYLLIHQKIICQNIFSVALKWVFNFCVLHNPHLKCRVYSPIYLQILLAHLSYLPMSLLNHELSIVLSLLSMLSLSLSVHTSLGHTIGHRNCISFSICTCALSQSLPNMLLWPLVAKFIILVGWCHTFFYLTGICTCISSPSLLGLIWYWH